MTAIFGGLILNPLGSNCWEDPDGDYDKALSEELTAQILNGCSDHFPSLQILAVTYCLFFHFLLYSLSFVTFLIKLGCSGGTESPLCSKQNQPKKQNPKIF